MSNVPELRFSEFALTGSIQVLGEWEEKTLSDFMSFKNGVNADKSKYGSGTKFINVLDVIAEKPITSEQIIDSVEITDKEFQKNEVIYGDILFQRSSETREEVGQSNIYVDDSKSVTFGGFVIRGRPIIEFNPFYFNYLLKTSAVRKEITTRSGGSTRYNVGQATLGAVVITVTANKKEQQKIATFLSAIDKKLGHLHRKHALLETYKRGIMQKIFSQELRFKPDDGTDFPDWEEKKVSDVFRVTRGNVLAVSKMTATQKDDSVFPVYSSQTKNKGLTGYFTEYLYENAITWTTDGANAGDVKYRKGRFYCTNVCGVLISSEGFANQCVAEILNKITHRFVSYVGNPKLMNNVMATITINYPSVEEQQKISNFLSTLDKKLEAVQTQIDQTETFKKGLLQRMFV